MTRPITQAPLLTGPPFYLPGVAVKACRANSINEKKYRWLPLRPRKLLQRVSLRSVVVKFFFSNIFKVLIHTQERKILIQKTYNLFFIRFLNKYFFSRYVQIFIRFLNKSVFLISILIIFSPYIYKIIKNIFLICFITLVIKHEIFTSC